MPQTTDEGRCNCVRVRAGKQIQCELGEGHDGPHYTRIEDLGPFLWTGGNRGLTPPRTKLAG